MIKIFKIVCVFRCLSYIIALIFSTSNVVIHYLIVILFGISTECVVIEIETMSLSIVL